MEPALNSILIQFLYTEPSGIRKLTLSSFFVHVVRALSLDALYDKYNHAASFAADRDHLRKYQGTEERLIEQMKKIKEYKKANEESMLRHDNPLKREADCSPKGEPKAKRPC